MTNVLKRINDGFEMIVLKQASVIPFRYKVYFLTGTNDDFADLKLIEGKYDFVTENGFNGIIERYKDKIIILKMNDEKIKILNNPPEVGL